MNIFDLLKSLYVEQPVTDEALWHKCRQPNFRLRTTSGAWFYGWGQAWRRKVSGRWEYRQDEEVLEDWLARH